MNSKTIALFGAGKIGRSFIAQVFARNGYEVVFIDLDVNIIEAINREHRYRLVTLESDGSRHEHWVEGVRGIDGRDKAACRALLLEVPLVATSVGAGAIPVVCKEITAAAQERADTGRPPFDLILAENMRGAADVVRQHLINNGLATTAHPGLIEASIGKTSPDVPANERAGDPLLVYADSYNTLVLSANGWVGEAPQFPELYLADSITAYVDRKLFIHNLAHCAFAYFGYQQAPAKKYIHQVAGDEAVCLRVEDLINVSASALVKEYPQEFTSVTMKKYQQDVFERISNPALQDTVWRVGRDIPRKLGRTERIVGSLLLALGHGLTSDFHVQLYVAALSFHARDERGELADADRQFHADVKLKGISYALHTISEFNNTIERENKVLEQIIHLSRA